MIKIFVMNSLVVDSPILEEILRERARQDRLWGKQDHPFTIIPDNIMESNKAVRNSVCNWYEIPTEERAKEKLNLSASKNELTWSHIIIEELSEAISEADPEKRRAELIQLAAVVIASIENIDQKRKENGRK